MIRGATPEHGRYLAHWRGDRLHPAPWHGRYHLLNQLRDAIRDLAVSSSLGGESLLDFGCAESPYQPLLGPRFRRYVRADLPGNPRADVTIDIDGHLPLPDASIDVVLSTQVLEHVAVPAAYLAEARRVLRPGGRLLLSTHGAWKYHPDPVDLWRWTREGLRVEVERAGFRVVEVRGILGPLASALQLLQDAIAAPLPRLARPLPGLVLQRLIGLAERRRVELAPPDAAIYLILAERPR